MKLSDVELSMMASEIAARHPLCCDHNAPFGNDSLRQIVGPRRFPIVALQVHEELGCSTLHDHYWREIYIKRIAAW